VACSRCAAPQSGCSAAVNSKQNVVEKGMHMSCSAGSTPYHRPPQKPHLVFDPFESKDVSRMHKPLALVMHNATSRLMQALVDGDAGGSLAVHCHA
jgi:hypothetical protein